MVLGAVAVTPSYRVRAATILVPGDYPTIQSALNAAGPGDTISVSAGTFPERVIIKTQGIHLVGASRDSTFIDGQRLGTVIWINASDVEIRGFTIQYADDLGWGVHVENANGANITDNSISASLDGDGVNLYHANNTLIENNIFSRNLYNVNITSSQADRVVSNAAESNLASTTSVQLFSSSESLIFNNTFVGGSDGVDLIDAARNNVTRNLITGMTDFGILLETSSYQTPPAQFPQGNTIIENTFQHNHIAINIQNATFNFFYHNDFFASSLRHANLVYGDSGTKTIDGPNFWDNSTLGSGKGGNFWDNYTGGDQPYVVGAANLDGYPLTSPLLPVPVVVSQVAANPSRGPAPMIVTFSAKVFGSLTPLSYSWDFGDGSPRMSSISPTHTFTSTGNYTVLLTISDTSGAVDRGSIAVVVNSKPVSSPGLTALVIETMGAGLSGLVLASMVILIRRHRRQAK